MITINNAPSPDSIILDSNNTLVTVTSTNGADHYFTAVIYVDGEFFDEQSWSRINEFTAHKDLKKLYNAYFEKIFNNSMLNTWEEYTQLLKPVSIRIDERLIEDDSLVQSQILPTFYIMYNDKAVPFDGTNFLQFLGVDPDILQVAKTGKLVIPFMVDTTLNVNVLTVELKDNLGNVIFTDIVPSFVGKKVFRFSFDLSTVTIDPDALYLEFKLTVGGSVISRTFRLFKNPKYQIKEIAYLNNFGYWMYAYLDGQMIIENALEAKVYEELDNTEKVFEINEKQTYTISTGSLLTSEKAIINQIATALEAKILLNNEILDMVSATKKVLLHKDNDNLYAENLVFSVKRNNSVGNTNLATVTFTATLTVVSLTNVSGDDYAFTYTSNYPVTSLFYETSDDGGTTWQGRTAVDMDNLDALIELDGDFLFRLVDVFETLERYSNSYSYITNSCVTPTLTSVIKTQDDNEATFTWLTNGFDYLSGTVALQYSIDDGTTWNTITDSNLSNDLTAIVEMPTITLGVPIKYRIICSGNGCTSTSNVIESIYANEYEYFLDLFWADNEGTEDREAFVATVDVAFSGMYYPPTGLVFRRFESGSWVDIDVVVENPTTIVLLEGDNQFYLRLVNEFGDSAASNFLNFTKTEIVFTNVVRGTGQSTGISACGGTMTINCKAQFQNSPIFEEGDRVFNNDETPFNGANQYFKMQTIFADEADPVYTCQIDADGYVINVSTCS